jgi:hypothetical protein
LRKGNTTLCPRAKKIRGLTFSVYSIILKYLLKTFKYYLTVKNKSM